MNYTINNVPFDPNNTEDITLLKRYISTSGGEALKVVATDLLQALINHNEVESKQCVIRWGVDDVHQALDDADMGVVSDEDAVKVLNEVAHRHDATIGVCWDTLTITADIMNDNGDINIIEHTFENGDPVKVRDISNHEWKTGCTFIGMHGGGHIVTDKFNDLRSYTYCQPDLEGEK